MTVTRPDTVPTPRGPAGLGGAPPPVAGHLQSASRRVLLISYLFPPRPEIGAQACAQIVRYLPLYGWTPVVLTVRHPGAELDGSGAEGGIGGPVIRTAAIPHVFDIYRQLKSRLRPAAVRAGEQRPDGSGDRGLKHGALSLLAVPDAFTGWIPPAVSAGLPAIRRHRIEHLFSSGPPWTSHLVGLILAHLSGLPWTAHFRDPWTSLRAEVARMKPVSTLSARLEEALERMVVRRANTVVCVTEEHAALLQRLHPEAPASKFITIPNGFDEAEWDDLDHADHGDEDALIITYAGALYHRRNPTPVLRALKALIDAGEIPPRRVRVDLLGWCDVAEGRRVREIAAECGLHDRVRLLGPRGRREALQRMVRSGILLLLAEGLTLQVPGKTYEYLRAGRPILALAPEGAVSRLLRRTGGAWVVDPADQAGLVQVLREAYRSWTVGWDLPASDPAVVAGFDRRILAGRFAEAFAWLR